tara:strand:- start:50 stop:229 length:180 start_codon:yes stop_codon:yes gene_type:complete
MPEFIISLPNGKNVDVTNDVKNVKSEKDLKDIFTKTLKLSTTKERKDHETVNKRNSKKA